MKDESRLARLEALAIARPGAGCSGCGLDPVRLIVRSESWPLEPGADCPVCATTRQSLTVRFVRPGPLVA